MSLNLQDACVDPVVNDPVLNYPAKEVALEPEQQYRASAYGLIAALLRSPPAQPLLDQVGSLKDSVSPEGDDLMLAMSALGLSAGMHSPRAIEEEFHELFIGLGKGEVVPYASWYLTGFLMEKPLSDLREDLAILGYQRDEDVAEPEDHAAALCEVMSLLITERRGLEQQRVFFETHLATWIERFLDDLAQAQSAVFYRTLGRFAAAFVALEREYLAMQV